MVKSNNKGFSLVEVIIAAAVFAILLYPITTALISAVNINKTSTKKQYAVETAEEILESFKKTELTTSIALPAGDGKTPYDFTQTGVTKGSITLPEQDDDGTYKTVETHTYKYSSNDFAIGSNYEKYTCEVEVSDAPYQVFKSGYILSGYDDSGNPQFKRENGANTNENVPYQKSYASDTGVVRNLNDKNAAIIVTATYNVIADNNNLDNLAYQHFVDVKKGIIRESNYKVIESQLEAGADLFKDDKVSKNTTIKIDKTGTSSNPKYTVTCSVEYTDNTHLSVIKSEYETNDKNVYRPILSYSTPGVVYQETYEGKLPPIYMIYVPAIYNNDYCENDDITIDNKAIAGDDAYIYILETAADVNKLSNLYKSIIKSELSTKKTSSDGTTVVDDNKIDNVNDLIYSAAGSRRTMSDVNVSLNIKADNDALRTEYMKNLNIFTNFDANYVFADSNNNKPVDKLDSESDGNVYMYDIKVTLTANGNKNKTIVTGTRGK